MKARAGNGIIFLTGALLLHHFDMSFFVRICSNSGYGALC